MRHYLRLDTFEYSFSECYPTLSDRNTAPHYVLMNLIGIFFLNQNQINDALITLRILDQTNGSGPVNCSGLNPANDSPLKTVSGFIVYFKGFDNEALTSLIRRGPDYDPHIYISGRKPKFSGLISSFRI